MDGPEIKTFVLEFVSTLELLKNYQECNHLISQLTLSRLYSNWSTDINLKSIYLKQMWSHSIKKTFTKKPFLLLLFQVCNYNHDMHLLDLVACFWWKKLLMYTDYTSSKKLLTNRHSCKNSHEILEIMFCPCLCIPLCFGWIC